jgi:peptidoglycan/xylan/chitin deacetylase (PgdA/CDA1 family)
MGYDIYVPSTSLWAKLYRRLVRYQHREKLRVDTNRPIVSFTFDDCPQSAFKNALPVLEKRGWSGTIYAAMGLCGTTNHLGLHMTEEEMQRASENGHEIADHTFSHLDANAVSPDVFLSDIEKNKSAFKRLGLPPANNFAYPYGAVNAAVKSALSKKFNLLRGIETPQQNKVLDLNQAASQRLYSGKNFNASRKAIQNLARTPGWLILFTHDVRDNPSEYGCTPKEFSTILDDVAAINADVLPVKDALKQLKKAQ